MATPPEAGSGRSIEHRLEAIPGWCAAEVGEEMPGLAISYAIVNLPPSCSPLSAAPAPVRERLASHADRFNGTKAVAIRREPVTSAYRVFSRHIGIDPDSSPTPIEAAARERLIDGGFLSRSLLADTLLSSLLDTSVPVWAMDADAIDGPLGIRLSREGEPLGRERDASRMEAGRLVIADSSAALALLLDEPGGSSAVKARSKRVLLYALQVPGVSLLCVEEALWICRSMLAPSG